jgi:hypothetical protein
LQSTITYPICIYISNKIQCGDLHDNCIQKKNISKKNDEKTIRCPFAVRTWNWNDISYLAIEYWTSPEASPLHMQQLIKWDNDMQRSAGTSGKKEIVASSKKKVKHRTNSSSVSPWTSGANSRREYC